MSLVRLNQRRAARVRTDADGVPVTVEDLQHKTAGARQVQAVVDSWVVDDAWWTDQPIQRTYWQCELAGGRVAIVSHDQRDGAWYVQN